MGEVYRATDSKLGREVAVKILPKQFAQDGERMARFQREAQVLASLNHPNIAAIYGIEEDALVMELVEGEMLRGPLPVETALHYIRQIIDAFEYAHEKGVIHRDLKPANVMVTRDGVLKVLDFGLAKVMHESAASGGGESSPTLTMGASAAGAILGTAAYMSPEQARGQAVDKRTDIWAFGVVVYEMTVGGRLFGGATIGDTLAAVLTKAPDVEAAPAELRRLLRRCLERDAKKRLRDIGDARMLLEDETPMATAASRPVAWMAALAAVALAAGLGFGWWRAARPVLQPMLRFNEDLLFELTRSNHALAISPDGTRMAFVARDPTGPITRLYTRKLDQAKATAMAGTETADEPFFSPDGQWIGFYSQGDRKLKKIAVSGGAAVSICDVQGLRGASWGADGNIVVAHGNGSNLSIVSSGGGTPKALSGGREQARLERWPQALAGGAILLSVTETAVWENANIVAIPAGGGQRKILHEGGYAGRYLASGHLLWIHQGTMFAAPMNPDKLELTGPAIPILEEVAGNSGNGAGWFDVSANGTVVYLSGKTFSQMLSVHWLDSAGKTQPLLAKPGASTHPALSPDGKRLALIMGEGQGTDLWVYEWDRDTMTRLTFTSGLKYNPVWSPDSKHVVFGGTGGIFWIKADGSGSMERLLEVAGGGSPYSFSPGGKRLAYSYIDKDTGWDTGIVPVEWAGGKPKAGKPEPFLNSPAVEVYGHFSPDGKWLAYMSTESGITEVYVRPAPGSAGSGKWQISNSGGTMPIWSPNGRELFYRRNDSRGIMAASYRVNGESFVADKPREWSDKAFALTGTSTNYDLSADGKRFAVLMEEGGDSKPPTHVTILVNFFDELRRRAPAGR